MITGKPEIEIQAESDSSRCVLKTERYSVKSWHPARQ